MLPDRKEKLRSIDLLRVLSVFGIVFTHVSYTVLSSSTPLTSFNWWVGNLSLSIARWCVPIFVMISGALLLDPDRNITAIRFYQKRLKRILVPLLFWTLFYLIYRSIYRELMAKDIMYYILSGEPFYHLWYLYMLAGLYLLTPFLRKYVNFSSFRERTFLIVTIFILSNGYLSVNSLFLKNQSTLFTLFIPYLAYYLCGYHLGIANPHKDIYKYIAWIIVVCVLCISMGTAVIMMIFNKQSCAYLYNYFSLPVIVMSVAIFWIVYWWESSGRKFNRIAMRLAERMASASFGIYLLHAAILDVAIRVIGQPAINRYSFLGILVLTALILFLCYIIVSITMKIPYLRRIVI